MKAWWGLHWDKVLTAVVSFIVAGVIGFFSAVSAVESEVARLRERIAVAENEISSNIKPDLAVVARHQERLRKAEDDVVFLKRQNEISTQTNKLLDLRIEQQRERTISELKELIEAAR